jgi:hypothetical protein
MNPRLPGRPFYFQEAAVTQAGYRHRVIVQDRSYSMHEILGGAQRGLDEFIEGLAAEPGRVTVSLWDFDYQIRCVHPFETPGELRGYQIRPRGGTDLYGAVGSAVAAEGERLAAMPEAERPEDVTVLVASDGEHNTTREYTGPEVKAMLERQQEVYGWRVLYMGCGQEAFDEGGEMGTRGGLTVNTVRTDDGQRKAWKMSSDYLKRAPVAFAAAAAGELDLTDDERALGEGRAAGDEGD